MIYGIGAWRSYYLRRAIFTSLLAALFWTFTFPAAAATQLATSKVSSADATAALAKGLVVGFQDRHGNTIFLHDFKGKTILLNLWAKWCAPCVQEMGSLSLLQKKFKLNQLVVLTISEDDSLAEAVNYFAKNPELGLTPFWDKGHVIFLALKARGLPTTLLVDKNGNAHDKIEGPVNWQSPESQKMLQDLMK